jgi:phenylalanyl-tRNA synthetase beta chain
MVGAGFFETMTFGFVSAAAAAPFTDGGVAQPGATPAGTPSSGTVPIANPLSETFAVLRPSVLPGLLAAVAHNRRREQRDVRVFEIGNAFSTARGERRMIACAWTGASAAHHWSGQDAGVDFFDIKGVDVTITPATQAWLAEGRTGVVMSGTTSLGWLGQLAPAVADQYGLPDGDPVYVAELDLDAAEASARTGDVKVEPLPRFPSITRDLSLLVDDTLAVAALRATAHRVGTATLQHVREFDRYQGKGVPDGKVSVSLRLTFRSPDRTLTDAEVQADTDAVLSALIATHHAVQR